MRTFKRILAVLAILFVAVVLFYGELILYGIRQGMGQWHIIRNARPVEEFLRDDTFPDSLKQKLLLIEEVRRFAVDSLGLKDTKNYRTLFDQKGKEVMWVVTACEPYQLIPKEWRFPVVGAVPYKGFFNEKRALALAGELEHEGWDVNVRNPGGWSTLGWFTDPILSKMLEKTEGDLASLIIHEMVHATIFVKDSVDFNENLASFIGDRGAEQFLKMRFGEGSPEFQEFIHEDMDYIRFSNHILRGTQMLDSLYQAIQHEPLERKSDLKEAAIRRIVSAMDTITFLTLAGRKPSQRFRERLPNNAYFMSFIFYQSGQDELWEEWQQSFEGDLKAYINYLRETYPFL